VVTVGGGGECAGEVAEEIFQFALCACETIAAQSVLDIDAFDSTLGTYGATVAGGGVNILDDGHIGINGQLDIEGKLTVQGSVFIGDGGFAVGASSLVAKNVYAVGTATQANSSTDIDRNAFFDGNVVGRFNITGDLQVPATATVSNETLQNLGGSLIRGSIPRITPCPCEDDEILDVGGLTPWAAANNDNDIEKVITSTAWEGGNGPSNITLPCGRYYITRIDHTGNLTIRAEGRTVLFVNGDMNIGGGLNLEIDQGAEIDLFIAGSLTIGANAVLGNQDQPSSVRTYVGGSDTILLNASSIFGGNLYAPRADVVFGASATLYGALFATSAAFSGAASVHFDSAVRNAGQACETSPPETDGGVQDAGFDAAGQSDAGSTDSGQAQDAGPETCSSCDECTSALLGCVIPSGETVGTCAPCQTDLNCCPPFICIAGACTLGL